MSIRRNLVAYLALFIALGGMSYAAVGAMAASATRLDSRAAHRSALPGCYPKGSTTIAQDKAGRLYSSGRFSRRWYVCGFRHAMPHQLPYRRFLPDPRTATVSGRYLAFFSPLGDAPRCCGSVIVIDMVTGHTTFTGVVNAGTTVGHFGAFQTVPPVLKSNGSVAWIYRADRGAEVHRHDSTGTAIVDSAPGIDPSSLAAGGSWLYWLDSGSPRSAPFH